LGELIEIRPGESLDPTKVFVSQTKRRREKAKRRPQEGLGRLIKEERNPQAVGARRQVPNASGVRRQARRPELRRRRRRPERTEDDVGGWARGKPK